MNDHELLSRVQGCLLGVQIGDALGMPVETMSAAEILQATHGNGIRGFIDPIPRTNLFEGIAELSAGDTTDDWQLTAVNARSLIRCRKYDHVDCAREHVAAYHQSTVGWGGTTRRAIAEVSEFYESHDARGRNPKMLVPASVSNTACGNGVAMKIAPFALFFSIRDHLRLFYLEFFERVVWPHGRLTHADPRASLAAFLVAELLHDVICRRHIHGPDLPHVNFMLAQATRIEKIFFSSRKKLEPDSGDDCLSSRLERIEKYSLLSADAEVVRTQLGTSSYAIESVPFALTTFLRHPTDFRAAILEAVNAGGDTDTNASIVGALLGANLGLSGIPEEWRTFRPEFREALELGEQLLNAAQQATSDKERS